MIHFDDTLSFTSLFLMMMTQKEDWRTVSPDPIRYTPEDTDCITDPLRRRSVGEAVIWEDEEEEEDKTKERTKKWGNHVRKRISSTDFLSGSFFLKVCVTSASLQCIRYMLSLIFAEEDFLFWRLRREIWSREDDDSKEGIRELKRKMLSSSSLFIQLFCCIFNRRIKNRDQRWFSLDLTSFLFANRLRFCWKDDKNDRINCTTRT